MTFAERIAAFGLVAVLAACSPAGSDNATMKTDPAADLAAIATIRNGYATGFKAGDAATLSAFFAEGAHDMENHTTTAVGPAGVSAALNATFTAMTPTSFDLRAEKIDVSGDLAYDRGTYKLVLTPKAGGAAVADSGRYLVVLKRQADGTWKLVEAMGNSATPMPMPPGKE